jgi:hypothetical protein
MRSLLFLVAALALVASGCAAPDAGDAPPQSSTSGPAPGPAAPIVSYGPCRAFHTFFPSPAASFEGLVPENFTVDADAGVVRVPVFGFDCANQTTVEMWALLPVVPPEPYLNGSYAVDALVLQAYTTNTTWRAEYLAWGLSETLARHATTQTVESYDAGAARVESLALADTSSSYTLRTSVQAAGGAFAAEAYRYWVANGTKAIGWVHVDATPSTNVGAGPATFESAGDEGAPPVTAGAGHRVDGVTMTMAWVPLA